MRPKNKWLVALVIAFGPFMAVLDDTIVNVALPKMQQTFQTNYQTITWVATGYLLAQATVTPIVGYLSDRLGGRRVFLTALGLFTLGSALCAFAPNEMWLIIFRVVQGIGGGALLPIATAMIFRLIQPQERGLAAAIIGVPILLAPAFGPTIGGYLTNAFDWHAIFTINIPVGLLALVLSLLILDRESLGLANAEQEELRQQRFDGLGLGLAMGGFCALVFGVSQAGIQGWTSPLVIGCLSAGVLMLGIFIPVELSTSDPVIDVRLFLNRTFCVSNILIWIISAVLFGGLFLIPFFFENLRNQSPLAVGEILIGQGIAGAIGTALSGWLYARVGPRILGSVGLALTSLGLYGLTQLDLTTSGITLQFWLILCGLGLSIANTPLNTLVLAVVNTKAIARASSLVNATRLLFSAMGVTLLTTYLTQRATIHAQELLIALRNHHLPAAVASCATSTPANLTNLQSCLQQQAAVMGFQDSFFLTLIASLLCVFLALFVGRDPAFDGSKQA